MHDAGEGEGTLVSVIVPTTCEASRAHELGRAVASVKRQSVGAELLLVVNGDRVSEPLLANFLADPGVRVLRLADGNVSLARFAGVRQSEGSFFCFLDDDDELLPDALKTRLEAFTPDVDVVSANGYLCGREGDCVMVSPAEVAGVQCDPMGAFLRANWFSSAAPLFRRRSVPTELFEFRHRFFEWTVLFFRLYGANVRFRFIDAIAYRIHGDTQTSASKSLAYARAYPEVLQDLWSNKALISGLDAKHRRRMRSKLAAAYNGLALIELEAGRFGPAWRAHGRCLAYGGTDYLAFTRKLLFRRRPAAIA